MSPAGRVAVSVELTLREGTARMWHCARVGGPTGPPAALANEEGEADLTRRRAHCGVTRRAQDSEQSEPWGETLWDGPNQHIRTTDDVAWSDPLPLIAVTPKVPGAIAYGSPWWLLDALCAVSDDANVIGWDLVRGASTEHLSASVDVAAIAACSPERLSFPRSAAEAFPAEVWLDDMGRIRRMSCNWPHKRRRWWWKRFGPPHWMTTEFWDFGDPVEIPPPDDSAWTRRE